MAGFVKPVRTCEEADMAVCYRRVHECECGKDGRAAGVAVDDVTVPARPGSGRPETGNLSVINVPMSART